jgi:hypothetical protein
LIEPAAARMLAALAGADMTDEAATTTSPHRDDIATLMAIGVVAYVCETLLHEAVGHGGMCLASGYRVTAIAPLWMHCSTTTPLVNLMGPAANLIGAAIYGLILRLAPPRGDRVRLFVWLSLAFNGLVAAGYMGVGGLTWFGDWPAVLAGVTAPAWLVRVGLVVAAVILYLAFLRLSGWALRHRVVRGPLTDGRLRRLAMAPALGAAIAALGAEVYGQGGGPLGLALAAGCTLVVGFSLTSLPTVKAEAATAFQVRFSLVWVVLALAAGAGFVLAVGPGYALTRFGG